MTIRIIPPRRYPHRGHKVYTLAGFRQRVARNLRALGFGRREVERLEQLYFGRDEVAAHQDEMGGFTNRRRYRLYALSRRQMKYDRKAPLFELVRRSGMFYVYVDEGGRVWRFVSPFALGRRGVMILG